MATDTKTEEKKRRSKKEESKKQKPSKRTKKEKIGRRRILPIWLRILIVLLLSAVALVVGVMVGYGVIGDGKPSDALEWETWEHIWNFVTKTNQ
jgi:hypothetical protein